MAKKKERNEAEYLRGVIRSLRSENKGLRREVNRMLKKASQLEREEEHEDEFEDFLFKVKEEDKKDGCPNCGERLEVFNLGPRNLVTCECGYKKIIKK